MKLNEIGAVGIVTKQNATKDVPVGGEYMNVKKLGLGSGKPKLHDKKATKNTTPNKLFNLGITEDDDVLYHATYEPFLNSILANGLGGAGTQQQWEDSKPGHVYLARDPEVAESHAEANEQVPDDYIDNIIVLAIDTSKLDMDKLVDDPNVLDDDSTLAYKGIIPSNAFTISESIAEGKRIPRKKGQKAGSKKHSDLYTDENPKGTIHGLKFATVKDAQASVRKIKSSGKKHAHKIQAAIAMEQRAKAAGKVSAAAVYRKYINAMKKKTKKMNELRIEKPDPKDTLGVKRKEMPQVKSDDYAEFIAYLQKNGAKFTKETIPARDLKAMQKEFSDEGIMKQLMKNIEQGPNRKAVIASSDDYIMDGHHRWLVAINTGADLNVFRVNLPAYELYDLVNKFEKTYYKDIYERGSIGVPFSSGLVMTLFPHRPLKIKKSTPGKLKYEDVDLRHALESGIYKHNEENITVRVNPDKSISFIQPQEYSIADDHDYLEYAQSLLADANNWTKVTNEAITSVDLDQLETFADKLFAKVGIDVEFTRHFLDRVNDARNVKPITMAELTRLFKQEFKRYGKPIAQMGPGQEAVMKDLQTDINLPFALQYDKDNNELDLIAKTVMRKKDFRTPDREFPVEGWSAKYKKSINCSNPKGFSQRAHCAGRKKKKKSESINEEDSLGSQINFPGFDKKEKKKPKYKPIPKKDKSVLDKIKGFFTGESINEAYLLQLERGKNDLVLHVKDTKTGERMQVRGKPGYETSYDADDELHQLLDIIGKASNISELMNGEIVNVNPKHPDGPKSYAALANAMNEDDASDKVYELLLDNIGAGPFDGGCVVVAQALQLIHGGELMALVRNDGTADHAVVQKGNTMYDFDGPGTQEEVVSRFEKNEGTRIAEVRKLRMTDLPDAPRNSELAKQIASLMKKPVQEAPTARDSMNLDADKLQQSIDYFYTDHAPKNFGSARTEGNFKGLKVVTFTKGNDTLMFLVNNDDQAVFYVMYSKFDDGVAIGNVRSNGTVKATEVYAYLVDKFGTLYSDDSQTPQGSKIWTSLAKFYLNLDVKDTGGRFVATKKTQVDEGVNDPHIFKAVFLAGGPGSGKSFVAQAILGGTGLRSVNSDEIYEFLMKKQGLSLDPETIFSPQGQEIRDKAKDLSRRREATYLDGRIGLVIDGTGKDVSKYQVMAQKLKAIGYDLSMIYVNTSLEVAQQRNKQRERSLKPAEVEKMWNNVQQNLMQFQQIFGADRFHIIDNSGGLEDIDRQKNFDKVYVETQRFLNTPPKNRKALAWIQKQKEQNDGQRSAKQPTTNQEPDGGTTASN